MNRLLLSLLLLPPTSALPGGYPELVAAALERTHQDVRYDGSYRSIGYPGGDVPPDIGVCSDVVIRSYRALGYDLQSRLHEDIKAHFSAYPSRRIWGLRRPDSNIDHRRVPNLRVFLARHGTQLPITADGLAYQPGELVTWMLAGNLPHIGIVTDRLSEDRRRRLIVHNIGAGPELADFLFQAEITGRYRYRPDDPDPGG